MISCQLFTHLDILLVCECASTRVREPPLGLHAKLRTFLFFFLIVCLCLVNPRMMKYAKSQTQDSEMLFPEDQKRGPHRQQLLMKLSFLCASSDCFPGNQQEPGVSLKVLHNCYRNPKAFLIRARWNCSWSGWAGLLPLGKPVERPTMAFLIRSQFASYPCEFMYT